MAPRPSEVVQLEEAIPRHNRLIIGISLQTVFDNWIIFHHRAVASMNIGIKVHESFRNCVAPKLLINIYGYNTDHTIFIRFKYINNEEWNRKSQYVPNVQPFSLQDRVQCCLGIFNLVNWIVGQSPAKKVAIRCESLYYTQSIGNRFRSEKYSLYSPLFHSNWRKRNGRDDRSLESKSILRLMCALNEFIGTIRYNYARKILKICSGKLKYETKKILTSWERQCRAW